jgi:hypothetical protein
MRGGTEIAPWLRVAIERRDKRRRTDVIQRVVDQIVRKPDSHVTVENLKEFLNIPEEGARRIIANLVKAGLMYEVSTGVWARTLNLPSRQRGGQLPRDV